MPTIRYFALVGFAFGIASVAAGDPSTSAGALPKFTSPHSIRIDDSWMGLTPIAPTEAVFTFIPEGDRVRATADYSARYLEGNDGRQEVLQQKVQLQIPLEILERFLALISEVEIRSEPYKPTFTHTDDYPSITIEVEGEWGRVTFFSRSQGERHSPWAVRFEGADFVVTSDAPQQAIDILKPHLQLEVFEELKRDARDRTFGARRPTSR